MHTDEELRQRRPPGEARAAGDGTMTAHHGRGPSPSLRFIGQAHTVAELLDAGYSNRQIAGRLGVSAARVSQIRTALPTVGDYLGTPQPNERLRCQREQLWRLRRQALELAGAIRRDLRELDEELEAADIDRLLGLR